VFARIFLAITLTTTVELVLLLVAGKYLGIQLTIAVIVLTGLLGAYLSAREGRRAWRRVVDSITRGELPADSIIQALMVLVGGLFLLTPGYLTDLVGFLCLIPFTRVRLAGRLKGVLAKRFKIEGMTMGGARPRTEKAPRQSDAEREAPARKVFDATDQQ